MTKRVREREREREAERERERYIAVYGLLDRQKTRRT